jgi:hypothetical protein
VSEGAGHSVAQVVLALCEQNHEAQWVFHDNELASCVTRFLKFGCVGRLQAPEVSSAANIKGSRGPTPSRPAQRITKRKQGYI